MIYLENQRVISESDLKNEGFYANIEIKEKFDASKMTIELNHPEYASLWQQKEDNIFEALPFEIFIDMFLPEEIESVDKTNRYFDAERGLHLIEDNNDFHFFQRRIYVLLDKMQTKIFK